MICKNISDNKIETRKNVLQYDHRHGWNSILRHDEFRNSRDVRIQVARIQEMWAEIDSHRAGRSGTTRQQHDDRSRISWPRIAWPRIVWPDPEDAGTPFQAVKVDTMTTRTRPTGVRFQGSLSVVRRRRAAATGRRPGRPGRGVDRGPVLDRPETGGIFIHLPAIGVRAAIRQLVPIDPAETDAVTEKETRR
ncbi:hypothetical protein [Stappia sp. TSB10GB4]|uniref:hypothetical protein n=1 Tax=Stappia sp. TSB10GB4 TaxID=2003584 RepID=UPI001647246C|nr:hypothetical protein [Stappia sp. TSB10GB4]